MLAAGALLAAQAGMRDAAAQTPNADDRLFRSRSDADPNNPTRLRSGGGPTDARIGGTDFDYRPGIGAGQTGFDSTNRRSKAKPKAKQSAKPPGNSAPSSTASAGLPPLPSTRPTAALPPGAAPASATVARATQSLERRGGPNYIPGSAGPPLETEDPAALPAPQVTPLRRAAPDPAPFDPIGIPAGAFILHPALDVVGGYDTNATRTLSKGPSWFESVAG